MTTSTSRHGSSAFTLIEMVIASSLSVLVVTSLLMTFIQQRKAYKAMSEVNDMVQNVRFAMAQVTRDLRMAGYGLAVPSSKIGEWVTWVSGVTSMVSVVDGASGAPDTLRIVTSLDAPVAYMSASSAVNATSISLQSGQGSRFNTTSRKVIYIGKTETARIESVSGDTLTVSRDPTVNGLGLRNAFAAGTQIELVKVITYSWLNDPSTYPYVAHLQRDENIGTLSYSWQRMTAGNIQDFQVVCRGTTNLVTLTGRASKPDPAYTHPTFNDRYRRYTLATDVATRQSVKK